MIFHKIEATALSISESFGLGMGKVIGNCKGVSIIFVETLRSHWVSNSTDSLLKHCHKLDDPPVVLICNVAVSSPERY